MNKMKKIPEHEHKTTIGIIIIIIFFLTGIIINIHTASTANPANERISALKKNLTEVEDWIRENSEITTYKTCYPLCKDLDAWSGEQIRCWNSCINTHFLRSTNISTERFFK